MSDIPVAVVSDRDSSSSAVINALTETGATVIEHVEPAAVTADALTAAEVAFVVGEPSLLSLGQSEPACPVVPIDVDAGRYDVPVDAIGAVVDAVTHESLETVPHPVLDVAVAGDPVGTAVTDVTLLTSEPARISEFGVGSTDGWLDTVRSDGVVVATPLGSTSYARAAGGPVLAPGTGLVTVPISAYAMHDHPWVLSPPISLSVERDEAAVSLHLDDEVVRSVPPKVPVDVSIGYELSLVAPQTVPENDAEA